MPDGFSLQGSQIPVELAEAGITLLAPGLVGMVFYHAKREIGRIRRVTQEKGLFDTALTEAELEDRHTIEIDAPTPQVAQGAEVRGAGALADDEVQLQVPSAPGEVQFALYADEDGVLSLHVPQTTPRAQALPSRAPSVACLYTYRIRLRRRIGRGPGDTQTRGIIGAVAHKLIKIIVGKALKGVAELGEYAAVKLWENNARAAQGFHGGTLAQLLGDPPTAFTDWKSLDGKHALLFLHGTTSTTHGAFNGLNCFPQIADRLWRSHDGYVLGFNHHTLTKHVAENVIDFYAALAASPGTYEFDVITHSRGGLVARAIAELSDAEIGALMGTAWRRPVGVKVKFNRIVFVGTPNNGTDLADPRNLPATLDRLANAIHMLRDAPITLGLGAVFATAAYVSETGLQALPGLVDQTPSSAFLTQLNAPNVPPVDLTRYFGVEADFYPDGGIAIALLKKSVGKLFHGEANDLIVPTLGVSNVDRLELPTAQVQKYGHTDRVHHTSYFRYASTWERALAFVER